LGTDTPADRRFSYEFDQFQRYQFLRHALDAAYGAEEALPIHVLDVGSGPEQLASAFLGDRFDVTRADIESFGQESIVVIPREGEFPFEGERFPVVLALEVLEHLPREERARLVRECLRVARDMAIFSCPIGRPDVVAAEARISDVFELVNGEPHPFLREHVQHGLPTEAEVRGLLEAEQVRFLVAGNSALDRWAAFLMLDQVLRTVPSGPELAEAVYRRVNASTPLTTEPGEAYRNFYVAAKQEAKLEAVSQRLEPLDDRSRGSADPVFHVARVAAEELSDQHLELTRVHSRIAELKTALTRVSSRLEKFEQRAVAAEEWVSKLQAEIRISTEARDEALAAMREAERKADLNLRAEREALQEHARLAKEFEQVRSAFTRLFSVPDRQSIHRLLGFPGRIFARRWENHPFAAEPHGQMLNILSDSHSVWCAIGSAARLEIRTDLDPTTYLLVARVMTSTPATLLVDINGQSIPLGRASSALETVERELTITKPAKGLSLSFDRALSFAGIGDFQILRRIEENLATTVKHRVVATARQRPTVRRFARTSIGRLVARRLQLASITVATEADDYEAWIAKRLVERAPLYPKQRHGISFSVITTAWNTPASYLEVLATSVLKQQDANFNWLLLDNGSTAEETIAVLQRLAKHNRVRFERTEENLGIIGGMRSVLERASGDYVVPVDSDDYLYPDALRILAVALARGGRPALAYSDEDKIYEERHRDAYLKPDWDPVLFLNSCYIAHLCAIERTRALELDVYGDTGAEGCHDWDTFLRFMLAGYEPLHVPEVLYGWRMHPESAAMNIESKPFLDASHTHVLRKFLDAQGDPKRYWIERSPLWGGTPDWWFRRYPVPSRPLARIVLSSRHGGRMTDNSTTDVARLPIEASPFDLRPLAESAATRNALLQLVWDEVDVDGDEWPSEVLALMELYPDTVIVGGRVIDAADTVAAAGEFLGVGGDCGCADIGRSVRDPGYFGQMWKQRSVSAIPTMLALAEPSFVLQVLDTLPPEASLPFFGAWAGATAARIGARIVYTPHLVGRTTSSRAAWDALITPDERRAFTATNRDVIPETRYLAPLLSLDPAKPYEPSSVDAREAVLRRWRTIPAVASGHRP
jgi:hypothetical protein